MAEGIRERAERALHLHDEIGEVDGLAAVTRWSRYRRHDGDERARVLGEGQPADEGGGEVRALTQLLELRGEGVVDNLERHAALRRHPLEEAAPSCGGAGCDGIHTRVGDPSGHGAYSAKTSC